LQCTRGRMWFGWWLQVVELFVQCARAPVELFPSPKFREGARTSSLASYKSTVGTLGQHTEGIHYSNYSSTGGTYSSRVFLLCTFVFETKTHLNTCFVNLATYYGKLFPPSAIAKQQIRNSWYMQHETDLSPHE
jgi:hypothetical protein